MFFKFKDILLKNYPENNRDEFIESIESTNYIRAKYSNYILVLLAMSMHLVSIISKDDRLIVMANMILLIMVIISAALFFFVKDPKPLFQKIMVYIETIIVILWSATLIMLLPNRYEFLTTYSIVIIAVLSLLFLKWQASMVTLLLSGIMITWAGIDRFVNPVLPKITTLIILLLVSWLISRLLYKKELDGFIAEKLLEEKTIKEAENNLELMEANSRIKSKNDQLVELNELLRISQKDAISANIVKTDFLARMSHDMRTPLTALIGMSEFGIDENRDPKDLEYFKKIKDSADYLLSLVNDTLDLQKLESNKIDLNLTVEKCDSAINKVLAIMELEAEAKGIELILSDSFESCDVYIEIDEKRVEQILINILSNAIKYTEKGGKVVWDCSYESINNEHLLIKYLISDTGVGMSQSFMERMYEPFTKENNDLSNTANSTGLGLAICKNLIEIMGGSIKCESEIGKGTTFSIEFPHRIINKEDAKNSMDKLADNDKLNFNGQKKALICEDSIMNAEILSKILKKIGIIADHGENGAIGLELFKENDYDIIFMDIKMPIMDGVTTAKKIREIDKTIPIIALSANAYEEDIKKSLDAGMNAHLSKPFDREAIYGELSKLLN